MLVTTGVSRDDVVRPARILHAAGVEVYTVGVGRVSVRYLRKIATDRFHVFSANVGSLLTIVRTLKDKMCHSPGKSTENFFHILLTPSCNMYRIPLEICSVSIFVVPNSNSGL